MYPSPERDSDRPIRVGERPKSQALANRWATALTAFMRVVAGLWILQGLLHWARVLAPGLPIFDTLPMVAAYLIIIFAVIDLIAGIGMWLIAPWGGVMWLFAASTQIFVSVAIPNFFPGGRFIAYFDAALIVAYFILTYNASEDRAGRLFGSGFLRR